MGRDRRVWLLMGDAHLHSPAWSKTTAGAHLPDLLRKSRAVPGDARQAICLANRVLLRSA